MKSIKVLSVIIGFLIFTSSYLIADIVVRPPTDSKPPRVKKLVKPEYPKEARKVGKEGIVIVTATIDVKGIPQNIVALTQLGFGFEEAAIEALKKTTFYPATKKENQ